MIKTCNQKVSFVDFESLNQLIDCILKSERHIKKDAQLGISLFLNSKGEQ